MMLGMDFGEGEPHLSWRAHCGLRLLFFHCSMLHFSYCRSRSGMEGSIVSGMLLHREKKVSFPVTQSSKVFFFLAPSPQRLKFLSTKREKSSPTWRRNLALFDLQGRFSSSLRSCGVLFKNRHVFSWQSTCAWNNVLLSLPSFLIAPSLDTDKMYLDCLSRK